MEKQANKLEQQIKDSSRPNLSWWKKLLLLVLLIGLGLAIYYIYLGQIIGVLSVFTVIFLVIGIVLVFVYLVSQDLFLWLIGRRSEYQKLIDTSRIVAVGLSKTAINYAPLGLTNEEKVRLKEDVPIFLHMRFMTGINNFIARIFIGAFAAAFGLLGTVLLMKQNEKLDIQNEKLSLQNDRINIQNNLIEADRRSSLVFLMSNVLDKVDEEISVQRQTFLNNKKRVPDNPKFRLSTPLIGRIVALSRAFKPYRMLEGDFLSTDLVSPERGQLFIALMSNELDSLTQNTILRTGNFSKAVIGTIDLKSAKFRGANLGGAYLNFADLCGADLCGANLKIANLSKADLHDADLCRAYLSFAKLNFANLRDANLRDTDLSYAKLFEADLIGADLSDTDLSGTNLNFANLSYTDLSGANLNFANLNRANLIGAYFFDANLSHTKGLTITQLKQAKTLYKCKFPDKLTTQIEELKKEKPCLFTESGCQ